MNNFCNDYDGSACYCAEPFFMGSGRLAIAYFTRCRDVAVLRLYGIVDVYITVKIKLTDY
ncbi:hypothetical protein [Calothrix sp. PCC 6303]|uniref:hypothetical protein n=1 Tax=Calothrix sp. PCC 6303 TaxID=1170562 RepID=UPI0011819FB3|nr:hypothetical protein [Calothrix sp. PCC 6303]